MPEIISAYFVRFTLLELQYWQIGLTPNPLKIAPQSRHL